MIAAQLPDVVKPPLWLGEGNPRYVVHLPNPEELPASLRVKFYRDHDTFAAYLQVWVDLGYRISWLDGRVAVIGALA